MERPINVLCAREFQNSISESVHKVLKNQIEAMGLSSFYDVQEKKIFGKNATEFSFEGIKNNVERIKSYEGIDYCWVEEGVKVSKDSWNVLIPTIRKEFPPNWKDLGMDQPQFKSEIWITFNPEDEDDYTYARWVKNPDLVAMPMDYFGEAISTTTVYESVNSFVVKMTYADNEWFPQTLRDEMEEDRKKDYDKYLWVWEGYPKQQLEGAVYAKELRQTQIDGRIRQLSWDRQIPVSTYWDLGRGDGTAIWFIQRAGMQWKILNYYFITGQDITHFVKVLKELPYVYDFIYLPWDGNSKVIHAQLSVKQTLLKYFPDKVRVTKKTSISDGINAARSIFNRCWFDEINTKDGINGLRKYAYEIKDGNYSKRPLHNWASHSADAFRNFAININYPNDDFDEEPRGISRVMRKLTTGMFERKPAETSTGWMS